MSKAADLRSEQLSQSPHSGARARPADHRAKLTDPERLAALAASELMDADPDAAFDRFTRLACTLLEAPVAWISLVDDQRQFFTSAVGLPEPWATARETPLTHSLCQYAVTSEAPLVVSDARQHPWLKDNLAIHHLGVVAYAGIPLVTRGQHVLGALCAIDTRVRVWTADEVDRLHDLAAMVSAEMELRALRASHKQMQEQLRRQTLVFQSTLEHMREGVIMVDPHGEFAVFNQAAKAFFGVSPQTRDVRALLQNVRFFREDGTTPLQESEQPIARALKGEASFPTDVVVRRSMSAPPTHLHITVDPILDEQSTLLGSVAVLHNATAQKAAERSAREEAAISELLQGIAVAANNAQTVHDAFQVGLDRVCAFMDWPVGHVYLKQGELLKPTGWWHDADPARFAEFTDITSTLEFSRGVGMIGRVLASGNATWLVDLGADDSFFQSRRDARAGLVSGFAFPVMIEDEVVAALEFYSERREAADPRLLSLMANIGTQLGRVIERERARKAILEQAEQVRSLSIRDELTGLHNRRGFLELARHQLRLAERMRRSVLLFFFDLNGMKPINDQLGHDEGDRALRDMAGVLRASFRASDIIARLGGDEFVALLPDADPSQIDLFVGRIELESAQRNVEPGRKYELSTSIGATGFDPSNPEPIEDLLVRADALMYEAKRARKKSRDSTQPAEPSGAPSAA